MNTNSTHSYTRIMTGRSLGGWYRKVFDECFPEDVLNYE